MWRHHGSRRAVDERRRIEYGEKGIEVAISRGGEERIDDLSLPREARMGLRGSLDSPPGAGG